MKKIVLAAFLVFCSGLYSTFSTLSSTPWSSTLWTSTLWAQDAVPGGTILPVQLNSAIRSDKAKLGQVVSARVMQDVPLPGSKIHSGAKILGHVVAVRPDENGTGAEIALRFDTLEVGGRRIAVTTSLRAIASMMEVSEAQVPTSGPDRGTSEYSWTTNLIGGEVNYGGGAVVTHGLSVVGRSVPPGVLVRLSANQRGMCRGDAGDHEQLQALWVFSSDACGVYGFRNVSLTHAGRTEPVGEIILRSSTGKLNIRGGSGMLLRVSALPGTK